jgi:acyl carrier protein phosphodiesterase
MNLLAHALLAGEDPEPCLGNVMADFIKGPHRRVMSAGCQLGIRQHQRIDAFTDAHPIVSRSKSRLRGYPYVGGILVDIFYDHLLSVNWGQHHARPLEVFIRDLYARLRDRSELLPPNAAMILNDMIDRDWLGCYATLDGIELTLDRLGRRLHARTGRDFAMRGAADELRRNFGELSKDFAAFFPELRRHTDAAATVATTSRG